MSDEDRTWEGSDKKFWWEVRANTSPYAERLYISAGGAPTPEEALRLAEALVEAAVYVGGPVVPTGALAALKEARLDEMEEAIVRALHKVGGRPA